MHLALAWISNFMNYGYCVCCRIESRDRELTQVWQRQAGGDRHFSGRAPVNMLKLHSFRLLPILILICRRRNELFKLIQLMILTLLCYFHDYYQLLNTNGKEAHFRFQRYCLSVTLRSFEACCVFNGGRVEKKNGVCRRLGAGHRPFSLSFPPSN